MIEVRGVPCGMDWSNMLFKKIFRSKLTFKNVVLKSNLESADSNQKFWFQNIQYGYSHLDIGLPMIGKPGDESSALTQRSV